MPRGKKKKTWGPGDNFLVPLEDDTYGQGQVLSYEEDAMNSVICAFSSIRFEKLPTHLDVIPEESLVAIIFVTRDQLDYGGWPIVNRGPIISWEKYIDIRQMRSRGFIGTKIIGTFNAETLLNAYHGLVFWDDFHDPEYLDKLLISPDRKPADVLLKPTAPPISSNA